MLETGKRDQLHLLEIADLGKNGRAVDWCSFGERLDREGTDLRPAGLDILQINVGKLCNQACHHCHVGAGPKRIEIMTHETMDLILDFLAQSDIQAVDVTGGAPELNPHFRYLVEQIKGMGRHVMNRCNLTVLFESGQEDLLNFFKQHQIELVCSLPCYLQENVDEQRGRGVFVKSIEALRLLNGIGYGREGSGLELHLVYNPLGASLPPAQEELEGDYKEELGQRYGIAFNQLYTITNMPISRFASYLKRQGEYEIYMHALFENFNPQTVQGLMCRSLISVDWEGNIYDCDFNQMLEIPTEGGLNKLWTFTPQQLIARQIQVADHCYGCTAGAGSSCGGELV